ncbi:heterokaryon incompatibility protein-domain-containing protein [Xylaria cubensis]|nr:heterokaryon incompatibility protein-domain-containing protein [Xylaria cubensis]
MRLLDTTTLKLKAFIGDEKPKYAILSHTWGDDEVLFEDLQHKSIKRWKDKSGADKVLKSCEICVKHGIAYIWIDTCCIDKNSSSELSEAINSMFKWYMDSLVCYAYLSDVLSTDLRDPKNGIVPFEESRWFTRGWTLQELIAPAEVRFFDKLWSYVGRRNRLAEKIHRITGIDKKVLRYRDARHIFDEIGTLSVHTKMVWARCRMTTRVEDRAYSLMGLFDVNMPLLYGEGGVKAFQRLQYEIVKSTNDQSILLHSGDVYSDHLATSPDDFVPFHKFLKREAHSNFMFQKISDCTNVSLGLCPTQDRAHRNSSFWGIVAAYFGDDPLRLDQPAIKLILDGKGGSYRRNSRIIYRVRHGDEGQMEIVDETGERIDILQHDLARREVVRLGSWSNLPGIAERQIRILVRPIVHKSISHRYQYYVLCPQAHRAVISTKPSTRLSHGSAQMCLVACVLLQNVELNLDPNLAILIFKRSVILYPYLVDIQSWLGDRFRVYTLSFMATHLSTLPIVTNQYKTPTERDVYRVITTLEREYDQNSGDSIVMSNGVQVTAWIREQMFFEDIVYHLHVEVNQQSAIPLNNQHRGKKNSLAEN